jgi:hypothetical protein
LLVFCQVSVEPDLLVLTCQLGSCRHAECGAGMRWCGAMTDTAGCRDDSLGKGVAGAGLRKSSARAGSSGGLLRYIASHLPPCTHL